MSKCYIPQCFPPYLCICQGVVTSPCIGKYCNDASGGDVVNELTLEEKPRRWQRTRSLSTCRHFLHLKKKIKKRQRIERLVVVFCIWEKNWKMMTSLPACHHLLHLKKQQKDDNEPGRLVVIYYTSKKNKEMMMTQGGLLSSVLSPFINWIKWISNTLKKL